MNTNLQIAFTEVKHILKYLTKEEKEKIPFKLRRFITDNCDRNHSVDMNNLSKRTYALLAVIYRKYLSSNKEELELEHQERLKKEQLARVRPNEIK
jgi:hypothetical protein